MKQKIFTKKRIKDSVTGWLFNAPLAIGLLVFTFVPIVSSLIYSFYDYDVVSRMDFVGFENYMKIFTTDRSETYKSALNTFLYTFINIPLTLILSYLLAVLVNKKIKGVSIFRVLYYLPVMIPAVVSGLLWKDIFDPTYGILNRFLGIFGLPPSQFFKGEQTALMSVFIMNMWYIGGGMILWLAAFKAIPNEVYESADIDGASKLTKLLRITIPMSTSMIFFNIVTMMIGTLQYNGPLTFADRFGRGVKDSLYMYAVKIYWEAFQRANVGYASALAWMLLLIIAALTYLLFKTSGWVYYGEES
jgi:multiple sugar transport system permease protein